MENHLLSEKIRSIADSVGIDAVGFAEASEFTNYALNHHPRRDPKLTLPNAKSIIIAGIYIGGVTMPEWKNAWYGRTSRLYLSGFFLDVVILSICQIYIGFQKVIIKICLVTLTPISRIIYFEEMF